MQSHYVVSSSCVSRCQLKCDGTRAETRFCLSAKRTSPLKSAGASVQSTTDSRGVRISGSNAGYSMFRGSVRGTGYPLHSPVSPSLALPCVTVCHHISTGVYRPLYYISLLHRISKYRPRRPCFSLSSKSSGTEMLIVSLTFNPKIKQLS